MKLVSVYQVEEFEEFLYHLLENRPAIANISHKYMPSVQEHHAFMRSHPYLAWYIIYDDVDCWVGSIYITRAREVGIQIMEDQQHQGYGRRALRLLRDKHPGKLLANIAIKNAASVNFFVGEGFEPLSITLELPEGKDVGPIIP